MSLAEPYSQASLTFVDDIGLSYGADTQGLTDFNDYEFTLPSQTQPTQSQASQLPESGKIMISRYIIHVITHDDGERAILLHRQYAILYIA